MNRDPTRDAVRPVLERQLRRDLDVEAVVRPWDPDPPDLVVCLSGTGPVGVEVVRVVGHHRGFPKSGADPERLVSSMELGTVLTRFSREIAAQAARDGLVRAPWSLSVEGPRLLLRGRAMPMKDWRATVRGEVLSHLREGRPGRGKGWTLSLREGEPRLTCHVSPGVHHPDLVARDAVARAIGTKCGALPRWPAEMAERWLLVVPVLPLAEFHEVEDVLRTALDGTGGGPGFDAVLWCDLAMDGGIRILRRDRASGPDA